MVKNEKKILVVEDSKYANAHIVDILSNHNYVTYTAFSGKEALELLNNNIEPDLILIDVIMGEIDGFEFYNKVLKIKAFKNVRAIFISANKDEVSMKKALEMGAVDYITKPFDELELILKIKNHFSIIKTNKELIIAKQKAEESEALKSAFLANMSHEIRTPLNSILGFSQLLNNKNLIDSKKEKYIEMINSSGDRLLRIISDIMDVSKLESTKIKLYYEKTDVNKIIDDLFDEYTQLNDSSDISYRIYKDRCLSGYSVNTDQNRLIQILKILINNAQKFTDKGFIEIGYEYLESSRGKFLKFYVKDTGIGIKNSDKKNIFKRFTQVENEFTHAGSGNGLGLTIAQGLVKLLKGKIWLESEFGKGSIFYFTIPYLPIEVENIENKDKIIDKDKSVNILIAEDNEINVIFLQELLDQFQYNVIHAKNGLEAVNIVNENKIDLILMDIKMPVMNGIEAVKQIRKKNSEIIIIAQTAYAMKEDRQELINIGCNDYIAKPISNEDLMKMLEKYIVKFN